MTARDPDLPTSRGIPDSDQDPLQPALFIAVIVVEVVVIVGLWAFGRFFSS